MRCPPFPWAAALGLALATETALACRYNVRDVGFVDFEAETHPLYCFVNRSTPASLREQIRASANLAFRDANVRLEWVDLDAEPPHPAQEHQSATAGQSLPAAVLLLPDDRPLPVPLTTPEGTLLPDLPARLAQLVSSPLREALRASVARGFGTVLLLEGTRPAANQQARQTILDALEQVRSHMKSLPKVIAEPPDLQVIPVDALGRESVLLQTLRLDTQPADHPRAAIFYGRGRWIGPVMHGEEIAARNIVGLFSIIGADCECGFDLGWTLGTRLPLRWPESLQTAVAKGLGFDPENPLVKMEITTIVNRRGTVRPERTPRAESSSPSSAPAPTALDIAASQDRPTPPSPSIPSPIPPDDSPTDSKTLASREAWQLLGGGAAALTAVAILLLVRARRQDRLD